MKIMEITEKLRVLQYIAVPCFYEVPKKDQGKVGVSYARQNFYFHSEKTGREKLIMRYEHLTEQREDAIEITFRIKVE